MKKSTFILLAVLMVLITSCGSTNAIKQTENTIDGRWAIQSITYDGIEDAQTILFEDVYASCFEGSNWDFVANNNRGTYAIMDDDCTTGERKFIWTIPGSKEMIDGELLLKVTGDNYKSETNAGYSVQVSNLSDTSMTWTLPTTVYGKRIYVNINFVNLID